MENKNYVGWIVLILVVIGILGSFVVFSKRSVAVDETGKMDGFAQCLASKKLTMYGAEWCPHCQKEKALFGASFKYVTYVECPENQKLCMDKGITGYPTWITEDGKKYEGEQGLEGLSKISGCQLEK